MQIGRFIDWLKRSGRWKRSVVILVADHLGAYPERIDNLTLSRFQIPVINACGIGACPSDATEEVKETCDFISSKPGGRGCVREVVEKVMKTKGDWVFDVAGYKAKF